MVYRYMFRGYPKSFDLKIKENTDANNISVFRYGDSVIVYAEGYRNDIKCEDIISGDFNQHPDGSFWENLADIFHYSAPQSDDSWQRKMPKEPLLRVNKLRHEKVSSYIFYHYQYQEEIPCDGDKYGIIFISGDLLFMYLESPEEYAERYKGSLNTNETPVDEAWGALMNHHFDMNFSNGEWLAADRIL